MREGWGREGFSRPGGESFIPAGLTSKPGLEARESTAICPTGLLGSRLQGWPTALPSCPTATGINWKRREIPFLPNSGGGFLAFQRAIFHHRDVVSSLSFPIQL